MQIFQSLRVDHDIQRQLCKQLLRTTGDTESRRMLFIKLRAKMESHAIAEERGLYIPLMDDYRTKKMARESIADHKEFDDVLDKLSETDYASSSWLKIFSHLAELLTHHLDREEREIFPLAQRILGQADERVSRDEFMAFRAENAMQSSF